MIRLRFVSYSTITSDFITYYEQFVGDDDFVPDHVEAVMPDGSGYLGAVASEITFQGKVYPAGVQIRPVGYDEDTIKQEKFIDLPAADDVTAAFFACLMKYIGYLYDFAAILGFAIGADLHEQHHEICSALMTLALRASQWFRWPLARPAHEIDPADLYLVLSAMVQIPDAA